MHPPDDPLSPLIGGKPLFCTLARINSVEGVQIGAMLGPVSRISPALANDSALRLASRRL